MASVDDIIQRLGGPAAAAQLTGVGLEAIRKWRGAGIVPPKHWAAIAARTGLSLDDFGGTTMPEPAATTSAAPELANEVPASAVPASAVPWGATAALVLADGHVLWGVGFGAHTEADVPGLGETGLGETGLGEICFSTGLTGYQETITDPSFAGQIITFTFPHIGNAGTNHDDDEAARVAARGVVVRHMPTEPSNWRAIETLGAFLAKHGIPGIGGIDTRALTIRIRDGGFVTGVIAHPRDGRFDVAALVERARAWPGLEGMDLAREVSCTQSYGWDRPVWGGVEPVDGAARPHVVAVDYGAKRNILRSLVSSGCRVTVVPATATAADILRHEPDGLFLSNGPGDPAATADYAVPAIRGVMAANVPVFGICLGHQLLALALGAKTYKLRQGHRGANQPVKELATGRVEITSQNHGFAVDDASLPDGVEITHVSLFDGSNEGIACASKRAFSVQYHPEAAPGPSDAAHLFRRFAALMTK